MSVVDINYIHSLQKEYLGDEKPINKTNPLVSVWVVAYQHINFISECLDNILMQKTDFPFEIVLAEDQSTDGTRELCIKYAKKYPDRIRLYLRDRKQTALYDENGVFFKSINGILTTKSCRGKYIAMCDGDDYWTDPLKLQKQIDFLEANREFSGCFHETQQIFEDGRLGKIYGKDANDIITTEDTISTLSPFHTSSFVYKNIIQELQGLFTKVLSGDMLLFSILSSFGPIKKISGMMSVYRKHDEGLTNTNRVINNFHQDRIELMNHINEFHLYKYDSKVKQVIDIHKRLFDEQNRTPANNQDNKSISNSNDSALFTGLTAASKKDATYKKSRTVLAIVCPQVGAISETFIRKHIELLAPAQTVVLTGNVLDKGWFHGPIKIIPIELGTYSFDEKQGKDIAAFLEEYSVTHILCEFGCIGGAVVELNHQRLHLPIYVHFHGQDASEFIRRPEITSYYKWMSSIVNGVIAVSKPMAERLINIGIPKEKIRIIHYGVICDPESRSVPENNPCKFISVSRLVGKKGVLFVLQAFERAKEAAPDITLDIIGDGPLRREIEIFISDHGLMHSVKLHGEQPHKYVLDMMTKSSVFVQHSIVDPETGNAEGLPLSILEASAHGLPAISTFHEGIPEAIEHEFTGFLVKEQDWQSMAAYMTRLAKDGPLRKKMGNAGIKKIINDGFTVEAMMNKLKDYIGLNTSCELDINQQKIKRVLFVNHNLFPFEVSGTPLSTLNHALGMVRRGLDVAVLIPQAEVKNDYWKEQMNGFTLYQIPAMDKFAAYFAEPGQDALSEYRRTIDQIVTDFSPQIVQINDYVYMPAEIIELFSNRGCLVVRNVCNCEELCHQDYPVLSSGLDGRLCSGPEDPRKCSHCFASILAAKTGNKASHDLLKSIDKNMEGRFEYVQMLYLEKVDKIIFTSEPFKNYFTRFLSIPADRIKLIPRGFDFSYSRANERRNSPDGVTHFAFIGNVMFSKGIDVALHAFEQICTAKRFVLHIYGEIVNSEYLDWLKRLESQYPGQFIYHGRFDGKNLPEIASHIDVCIIPSYFDTYNRVLREFLYLGKPIIATDFFGAYIVNDGKNGFRIPLGDANALAGKMIDLIQNPNMIEDLTRGAIQTQIPSLDEESNMLIETYNELYNESSEIKKAVLDRMVTLDNKQITSTYGTCRTIAFYLPQYHPIPENDQWWGKGFTEWTNVTKARPLFPDHYQPHLPADLGFYDLRLSETREAQAELARRYGISGFCYYHYWFQSKRLLNRVFDEVMITGKPDFPFCLCWANENWTRVWDGGDKEILMAQQYSHEDDLAHIAWFITAFKDPRYIKVHGSPLLMIYRSRNLPDPAQTAAMWREEVKKAGFPDLYLCAVESFIDEQKDPRHIGFSASVEFQPDWSNLGNESDQHPDVHVFEYRDIVEKMMHKTQPAYTRLPCVTPSWDNSPRRGRDGYIFHNSQSVYYEKWLRHAVSNAGKNSLDERIVFINAWNEWGEGNHLEPDQRHGHAYLHATKRALTVGTEKANLIDTLTEKAVTALDGGRLAEAEQFLVEALDYDPSSPQIQHKCAILLFQQGRLHEAIETMNRAVFMEPGNAEFNNDIGAMYHAADDVAKAQRHFEKALGLNPKDITSLKNLTEIFIGKEQFEEARDICSRLRSIYTDDKEGGHLWSQIQDKLALQTNPDNGVANNNLIPSHDSDESYENLPQLRSTARSDVRAKAEGFVCLQPFYMMEFVTDGHVYTCCPAWTKLSIGHTGEASIAEIWNSGQARLLRRKILDGRFHDVCNNICPHIAEYHHTGKLIRLNELERIEVLSPGLIKEIRAGRDYLTSSPTVFNLSNSTVCNLSCIMCTRHADGSHPELVQKTASELEAYLPQAKRITLSGMGDPFARPDTRNLMIQNRNKDLIIDLITNSLLIPRYWDDVQHCRFGNLLVSVDASDQQTYEKIRRGGTWKDLLTSLSLIRENSHRFQSVTLNMTVMRENASTIPAFIDFAKSYGFNASFQRIRGMYGDQNIFEMNDTEALKNLAITVNREKNKNRHNNVFWGDLLEFVKEEAIPATRSEECTSMVSAPPSQETPFFKKEADHSASLHESALKLFQLKRVYEAITKMHRALTIDPENAELHNDLGSMYHAAGDAAKAQACFQKALEINPVDITTLKNLTELFIEKEQFGDAREVCSRLIALYPSDEEADHLWTSIQNLLNQNTDEIKRAPEADSFQDDSAIGVHPTGNIDVKDNNDSGKKQCSSPTISIILSVKNNMKATNLCIRSFLENVSNKNVELTVVDNGSHDGTRDYLSQLRHEKITVILSEKESTPMEGCILGAEKASGAFLMFLDDSTIIIKSWLKNILKALENTSGWDALVGKTICENRLMIEAGSTTISEAGLNSRGAGLPFLAPEYNFTCRVESGSRYGMLIHRNVWDKVKTFDPDLEDIGAALIDLGVKMTSMGYRIVYQPQCILLANNMVTRQPVITNSLSTDPETLTSLRPPDLTLEVMPTVNKTDPKNVLILGIYLANSLNTVTDIVSVFGGSKLHTVTQKWVALNGQPPDARAAAVTVKNLNGRVPKFQIINELLHDDDLSEYDYIVLCDDDVVLPEHFVDSFIAMQSQLEFAIAQPARTLNSYIDHPIVAKHIGVHARETHFVEIGPVVSFHRLVYDFVFPFDLTSPMGWGYENVWAHEAIGRNLKMGIIDAVCVDHSLRKPVVNYEWNQADKERTAYLEKNVHLTLEECFRVVSSYIMPKESI
jgi:glycosyltransferase involved in cell wall biosynthesis/Flp pilus assembly protein TadD